MTEHHIHIKNAGFGYHKGKEALYILEHITCSFKKGQLTGIVGFNGSGKSTFLRTLAGLQYPLDGDIEIDGKKLSVLSPEDLSKKISVVLTEKISGFNLTTFDMVASGQIPYTNSFHQLKKENLDMIQQAMNICGVAEYADVPLHELSDGLFQKTLIAKSLAQQTPFLLFDEPSAYLDYVSRHQLFGTLKELAEKKEKCILVSSHDLDLVLKYCHWVLLLDNGQAIMLQTKDAALHPVFKKLSGGFI